MRIIEETLAPGAVVTEIARRHGISTSLVFTWRRRARLASVVSAGPKLVPVQLTPAAAESVPSIEAPAAFLSRRRRGLIEIELGGGIATKCDRCYLAWAKGYSIVTYLRDEARIPKDHPAILKRQGI